MRIKAFFCFLLLGMLVLGLSAIPNQAVSAQMPVGGQYDLTALSDLTSVWFDMPAEEIAQANRELTQTEKSVYLTFDDGPDPTWTPQILSILDRYGAGATFYMIGKNANTFPELVRSIAEHQQTIAVHGYNHMDLSTVDYNTFYREVYDTEAAILEALKQEPSLESQFGHCLRPPYGKVSETLTQNAINMKYAISMWNIDTKDWQQPDPEEMLAEVVKRLEPEKVILMHDGGEERAQTVKALQLILHELVMRGYEVLPYCTSEGQANWLP
ncbi:MAG TPA: polysaccharide deacetylase family protein [Chloroflexi bacterium]|jgi:peptidoglycan/xylan/chitin deacetylase (PgdA/CDA1 family)|nr:polysaccharide deacetylase family protein [Chloroflexota bacterium]